MAGIDVTQDKQASSDELAADTSKCSCPLPRWLSFGLSADREDRYRQAYLSADVAQARICILLLLVPVVAFAVNDYSFFGLSWRFYGLSALRLGLLLYTILLLYSRRWLTSYRSYDRSTFAWGLVLAVLTVTIHATRPPTFIAHAIIVVVIVFAMVLAIPNRFVNQLILSASYMAGEALVIVPSLWRSRQAGVTVLISMFVANTIAIACAWQLHSWRRREFLAREEHQKAKAEAERQLAERAQAEKALRGSEQRFHSLFDQMTEGFALHEIILDKQGVPCDYRFLEVNPAFEQLTGLNRDKVLEKTLSQVLPDDDPKWVRIYGEVALTGEAVHFSNYSPALNRHYDVLAYCPAHGRFAVLFTDITKRKQAEEALRENRQQLQAIIDGATETIVFVKDVEGRFITVNAAFEKLLGVKRDELRGKTDYNIVSKDRADSYRAVDRQVLTTGQPMQLEEVALLADGKEHVFLANKFPLFDTSGKPYALCAISADITERKRAEEALRRQSDLLRLSFDAIIVWRLGGVIESWNRGAEQLYGYSESEALGRVTHELLRPFTLCRGRRSNDG